jgi:hypothetical protein
MKPGTKVEVRDRFAQTWRRGFEVVETVDEGFRVRRLSDGAVLAVVFSGDEVRREKKRNDFWWI